MLGRMTCPGFSWRWPDSRYLDHAKTPFHLPPFFTFGWRLLLPSRLCHRWFRLHISFIIPWLRTTHSLFTTYFTSISYIYSTCAWESKWQYTHIHTGRLPPEQQPQINRFREPRQLRDTSYRQYHGLPIYWVRLSFLSNLYTWWLGPTQHHDSGSYHWDPFLVTLLIAVATLAFSLSEG